MVKIIWSTHILANKHGVLDIRYVCMAMLEYLR